LNVGGQPWQTAAKHYFCAKVQHSTQFQQVCRQAFHLVSVYFVVQFFLFFIRPQAFGQISKADSTQQTTSDSLSIGLNADSTTLDTTNVKPKKVGDIKTTVKYQARDSIRTDMATSTMHMYGDAKIDYGEISMKAEYISFSWVNNVVIAKGFVDSTGRYKGKPVFKQGSDNYEADTMKYNFKTKRGIISGAVTQQGEGYLHAEYVKRNEDNTFFGKNGVYTTCNLAHPHFYINATKVKSIPDKKIITGPFNLVIADVPTPLGFAFGYFPTPKNQTSGLIIPTYGEAQDRGFFLRNGGYYWAASPHVGLKMLGEIYSKGSYGFSVLSQYKQRYYYDGNLELRYNNRKTGEAENLSTGEDFWVSWSHMPQSRGSSSFSANVNAGTNSYNTRNSFDANNFISTSFSSNVSYAKTFVGTPFTMAANARLNQNVATKELDLALPDVSLNMNRLYPFKPKSGSGKTWYQKINFAYNGNLRNSISNKGVGQLSIPGVKLLNERNALNDSILPVTRENFDVLLDRMTNGMSHAIPVSTTFSMFKYFQVSPGFSYSENWYRRKLNYTYIQEQKGILVDTLNQFSRVFGYSAATNITTRIYGTIFVKKLGIEAIRHMMIPNVSFTYRPDFSDPKFGMIQMVQADSTGRMVKANPFAGQQFIFGGPQSGRSGSIGMSLSNNFEMKVKDKSDTTGKKAFKKMTLLDNVNFASSYNIIADSFKLAPINVTARTRLFNKLDINFGGTVDPYQYTITGQNADGTVTQRRINRYNWQDGKGLGQLTSANLAFSTSFNPKARQKKELPKQNLSNMQQQEVDFINANPSLYVDWNIPWNLSVSYNLSYSKAGFAKSTMMQTMNFNGDISLTEKWKLGASSGFDFERKEFSFTNLNIYRDLHCWEMRINWIPFGVRQSYSLDINVKAATLRDLKMSRRRSWYDR